MGRVSKGAREKLSVRVRAEVAEALRLAAEQSGVTLSDMAGKVLAEWAKVDAGDDPAPAAPRTAPARKPKPPGRSLADAPAELSSAPKADRQPVNPERMAAAREALQVAETGAAHLAKPPMRSDAEREGFRDVLAGLSVGPVERVPGSMLKQSSKGRGPYRPR